MRDTYSTAQPPIPRHEVPSMAEWLQQHQRQPESFFARFFRRKESA